MSLFLFHVCHEGSDGYKKWTLSFVSFYGIWKKQALPKKLFIDIFSALPAVYFYAPCRYIKAQSKYLKKKKENDYFCEWIKNCYIKTNIRVQFILYVYSCTTGNWLNTQAEIYHHFCNNLYCNLLPFDIINSLHFIYILIDCRPRILFGDFHM